MITWTQLINEIRRLAAEAPARIAEPRWSTCGEPECLAAHAMDRLGVDVWQFDVTAHVAGANTALLEIGLQPSAWSVWLRDLTKAHDHGLGWGLCVEYADAGVGGVVFSTPSVVAA